MILKLQILYIIFLVFFLNGCKVDCNESIITGFYVVDYFGGKDNLILDKNGGYIHRYTDAGQEKINSGLWNFEMMPGEQCAIGFERFVFRNFDKSLKTPGWWHVEIEKDFFGKSKLCFEPDDGFCFKKIK